MVKSEKLALEDKKLFNWICQVRTGNPRAGQQLQPEDFFRPEKTQVILFSRGIKIAAFMPSSRTVMIEGDGFCVTKKPFEPKAIMRMSRLGKQITHITKDPMIFTICTPQEVGDDEVVFVSPTIKFRYELIQEIRRQDDQIQTS